MPLKDMFCHEADDGMIGIKNLKAAPGQKEQSEKNKPTPKASGCEKTPSEKEKACKKKEARIEA